jgi:predicted nucleic acid-binding protein
MVPGLVSPGEAEAIVAGDKDLLVLGAFKGAAIMTPRAFWEFSQSEA